jgi:hypothetical protein
METRKQIFEECKGKRFKKRANVSVNRDVRPGSGTSRDGMTHLSRLHRRITANDLLDVTLTKREKESYCYITITNEKPSAELLAKANKNSKVFHI